MDDHLFSLNLRLVLEELPPLFLELALALIDVGGDEAPRLSNLDRTLMEHLRVNLGAEEL